MRVWKDLLSQGPVCAGLHWQPTHASPSKTKPQTSREGAERVPALSSVTPGFLAMISALPAPTAKSRSASLQGKGKSEQERGCEGLRENEAVDKPWVSLGQGDEASTSVGKEQKRSRAELKAPSCGDPAHSDWGPGEARKSQHFQETGAAIQMDAQTWSGHPFCFLSLSSLSSLSLSLALFSTSLPVSLSLAPKLQPSFSNRHNQGGVQGALVTNGISGPLQMENGL